MNNAKLALLHRLLKEENELVGRFLSEEEQLRLKSLQDEIDRLDYELDTLETY